MQNLFQDAGDGVITIPPFEDSHMHFTFGGRPASTEELKGIMDACERYGIFSLKDMGHKSGVGLSVKKNARRGLSVRTAGYALFKKGGYGKFLGKGVKGKEEIVSTIREIAGAGADFIKVINSGIVSIKGSGIITDGGFSSEELKIIREETLKVGLELICHANSDPAIRSAVIAGASSIEHGFFISRETLRMMSESATAWTPTVYALWSLASLAEPSEKGYIERVVDDHLSSLHYAASVGVSLSVGTDSGSRGVRHGESLLEELRLWERAGLSPGEILSCACMDSGEIARGNYLVVRKDFFATGKIDAVYRNGIRMIP
jgi:imidazolonepropionase-like amidohydrolase